MNGETWNRDADSPYTDAARVRVATSAQCAALADAARDVVPVRESDALDALAAAAQLCAAASAVLESTVVAARVAGVSWSRVGDVLAVTRQTAHGRYAAVEQRWRAALADPAGEGLPDPAADPAGAGARLDAWVAAHAGPGEADPGDRPVSAGLPRMGVLTELAHLERRRAALAAAEDSPAGVAAAQLAADYERAAVLHDRLAARAEAGWAAGESEAAAACRARAAQLRAAGEQDRA